MCRNGLQAPQRAEQRRVGQLLQWGRQHLGDAAIEGANLDARVLLGHVLQCSHTDLFVASEQTLPQDTCDAYADLIARRCNREPVAYLLGEKEFWGLDFHLTHATLIPRPDSETMMRYVDARIQDKQAPYRIVDLGTGSGCLVVSLLKMLPQARGLATDVSAQALAVAERNLRRHGVEHRCATRCTSWMDEIDGMFDIVVSNPPYIGQREQDTLMADVVAHEPHQALFAGEDGLDAYRILGQQLPARLAPKGFAVLEHGHTQAEAVAHIMQQSGLTVDTFLDDLAGCPRCVVLTHTHHV